MFVVSVPGKNAAGISRDDMIYAYNKNGRLLWKYVAEGVHLTPVEWADHQTLVVTNSRVLHATGRGYLLLDEKGKLVKMAEFDPPASCDFRVSPDMRYAVGYDFTNVFAIDLFNGELLWQWRWQERNFPVIRDCYFSSRGDTVVVSGSSSKDRGHIFIFSRKGSLIGVKEFVGDVDRYGRSLRVYFSKRGELVVISSLKDRLYRFTFTQEE